ncbi:hypothetical protein GLOTRDRAFT_114891 [Gloeophyllum trabeum ATCC 11539]|uniref:Uncharacterized protein n=1 Tax=Gloeophyllum trabeum (strain ATCC 11539 / FP-39264 / Madison 617) TaxID=670483 RepID=S7QF45_GLOTA|nr:uncharacterized protein GLOTRDRAFT_114891 [Gloeophyllum trabeum ATCC 11539]EPQ58471.1 hypothetical protein GLOTRDRAFT_114891 [Gloeophyllum trabeum ATCC 11539]
MFKLRPNLAAPFGLLGDEAKLSFRSQAGGIAKLASTRNISGTDAYWNQYVELFDSASDVFSLISPNDIRRALLEAPENVATLIRVISTRLFNLVSDHTFPSSSNPSVASLATSVTSFIKSGAGERNTTKEALNCIRVLQRVFPVVFELEGEASRFELEVLWKKEEAPEDHVSENTSSPQFVIEDEDDDEEHEGAPQPYSPQLSQPKATKTLPSLAERLFSCLIDLMFCCGFTLPVKLQVDHYKINYVIWEKGVGSTVDPGPSQSYDSNKTEVLRLLLVLFSKQIYVPPSGLLSTPSPYTLHFVQHTPRRDVLTVLCSLLNTAMNSHVVPANIMSGMTTKLPYNHLVFKGEDLRATLVGTCLQVLCVLLDCQSGSARDLVVEGGDIPISTPTSRTNAFRYFLAKLHRTQDFTFIADGILAILQEQMASFNNLLPGSRKPVPYIVDTIVLFWKMIELNKKFRVYILETDKGMDIAAYLLCYCLEIKDKPQQHGLCRAISYIIQTLSAERSFGLKLISPVKAQLPAKWQPVGTAGDFMVNAIYAIVATTSGALNSLYPALIIALSNCAPYFKNLSVTASTRLVQLFTSFSSSLFLLSDEGHPRLLYFMLEVFNGVILHNLSDNPHLIHAILGSHKVFENLGTFTLARGLRDVRRAQQAKEEQARRAQSGGNESESTRASRKEKAKLLQRDSDNALGLSRGNPSEESTGSSGTAQRSASEDDSPSTRPLMSPTTGEAPTRPSTPPAASEKARGKMKERRSMSMDESLERIAAAGIGRNGFVPTQEWVTSWQQGLPLDPIMLVISELFPKVQDIQNGRHKSISPSAIVDFLSNVTLKDVLPPPPPVTPRRFIWSDASIVWLTSLMWGEIYVRGMTPLGIWNSTNVRLFYVKHTQTQQLQIKEAVSSVVGGLLGRSPGGEGSPGGRQRPSA